MRPTRREMAEEEVAGDELDGDGLSPVGMAGVEYSGGRGEDFPQPDAVGGAEWSRRRLRRPVGGDGAWFGPDDAAPDAAQERDAGYGERGATGESGPTVPPAGTVDGRVDSAFGTPGDPISCRGDTRWFATGLRIAFLNSGPEYSAISPRKETRSSARLC